jgi:hypothetical protein
MWSSEPYLRRMVMSDEIKPAIHEFGRNCPVSWEVIYAICGWKPKNLKKDKP